jgi:ribonuclease BN (tRNA processing enzyme)
MGMNLDLTGKSLQDVVDYLKSNGYVPCSDDEYHPCPCGCPGLNTFCDVSYKHDKYDITLYQCDDDDCDIIFYEILPADPDKLPDHLRMRDGIMVSLK